MIESFEHRESFLEGLGFRVSGLGFRVQGLGLGFRVQGWRSDAGATGDQESLKQGGRLP